MAPQMKSRRTPEATAVSRARRRWCDLHSNRHGEPTEPTLIKNVVDARFLGRYVFPARRRANYGAHPTTAEADFDELYSARDRKFFCRCKEGVSGLCLKHAFVHAPVCKIQQLSMHSSPRPGRTTNGSIIFDSPNIRLNSWHHLTRHVASHPSHPADDRRAVREVLVSLTVN